MALSAAPAGAETLAHATELSSQSSQLGLDFWGVPLACLLLTLGYVAWMVTADRREAARAAANSSDAS